MSFKKSPTKRSSGAHQTKQTNKHWWSRQREQRHNRTVPSRLKCFLDYSAFKGSPAVDLIRGNSYLSCKGKAVQCTARLLSYGGTTSKQGERVVRASVGQLLLSPPDLSETASSLAPSTLFSSLHCIATLESKNGRQRPKIFRVTHS